MSLKTCVSCKGEFVDEGRDFKLCPDCRPDIKDKTMDCFNELRTGVGYRLVKGFRMIFGEDE